MGNVGSLKSRLQAGGVWALVGKIIGGVLLLSTDHLLAERLSRDAMGTYFLVLSVVILLAYVSGLGMPDLATKFISERRFAAKRPVGKTVARTTSIAFVGLIGTLTVYSVISTSVLYRLPGTARLSELLLFVISWAMLFSVLRYVGEAFRGFQDIRLATLFGESSTGGMLPGAVLLGGILILTRAVWSIELALYHMIAGSLMAVMVAVPIVATFIRKSKSEVADRLPDEHLSWRALLKTGWPISVTTNLHFFLNRADLLILAMFSTATEVAIYGVASRLVRFIVVPLAVVNSVVTPVIAELNARRDLPRLESILRSVATLAAMPSVLLVVAYFVFGPVIIQGVYTSEFSNSFAPLCILSIGQLFNVASGSGEKTLIMTGNERLNLRIVVSCSVLMFIAAVVGAKLYGALGLACAVAGVMALRNVALVYGIRKVLGIWVLADVSAASVRKSVLGVLKR